MNRAHLGPAVTDNALAVVALLASGAIVGVGVCIVVADRVMRKFLPF